MKYLQEFWAYLVWLTNGWKANDLYQDNEEQPEPEIKPATGLKIWKTTYPDGHDSNEWDLKDYIELGGKPFLHHILK